MSASRHATGLRAAVVGHVEWVTFLDIDRIPAAGEIAHAGEGFDEPAGGGGVAAVELARLAGGATLFTALGEDEHGHLAARLLAQRGVTVQAARHRPPQRRAIVLLDAEGERTIIVQGAAAGPSEGHGPDLSTLAGYDAVYFCKGDAAAVRAARAARILVATARTLPTLRAAGVPLDALVLSARDPGERYHPGDLEPAPALVAYTEGGQGGRFETRDGQHGRWEASPLPGPVRDAYGAGDTFAAALTYALGLGLEVQVAVEFAASRGAMALCRRGAHGGA